MVHCLLMALNMATAELAARSQQSALELLTEFTVFTWEGTRRMDAIRFCDGDVCRDGVIISNRLVGDRAASRQLAGGARSCARTCTNKTWAAGSDWANKERWSSDDDTLLPLYRAVCCDINALNPRFLISCLFHYFLRDLLMSLSFGHTSDIINIWAVQTIRLTLGEAW